ncbi:pyridoxamine 5'-phosphate oxidase family protein [Nonomuraea diastatica]|uniref:pyridoxamine 5'-phosphate oxidase family protein n=1 Tax=Nonomuraea diastatica TaxID=1848329 RepID=UPI0015F2DEB5|nr:pyridoxamine 5'-phosphate oxidase family protein [Nonomuraea diastatica]
MSTTTSRLTAEDLELLARPLYGFLSVAGGTQPPQPRPVWFEATAEGTVQFITEPDSLKMRRLRRDPRGSIVVAAPVGERERWVSVAGRTTVEADGAHDLCARLAARYWDLDGPGDVLHGHLSRGGQVERPVGSVQPLAGAVSATAPAATRLPGTGKGARSAPRS